MVDGSKVLISIHALRKESDQRARHGRFDEVISIHALRKESDRRRTDMVLHPNHFNPRSP